MDWKEQVQKGCRKRRQGEQQPTTQASLLENEDLGQRSKRRAAGRRQVELSARGSAAVVRVEQMGEVEGRVVGGW